MCSKREKEKIARTWVWLFAAFLRLRFTVISNAFTDFNCLIFPLCMKIMIWVWAQAPINSRFFFSKTKTYSNHVHDKHLQHALRQCDPLHNRSDDNTQNLLHAWSFFFCYKQFSRRVTNNRKKKWSVNQFVNILIWISVDYKCILCHRSATERIF